MSEHTKDSILDISHWKQDVENKARDTRVNLKRFTITPELAELSRRIWRLIDDTDAKKLDMSVIKKLIEQEDGFTTEKIEFREAFGWCIKNGYLTVETPQSQIFFIGEEIPQSYWLLEMVSDSDSYYEEDNEE